jgi:hypothetical protein
MHHYIPGLNTYSDVILRLAAEARRTFEDRRRRS